jgi:hypothetical protein
MEVDLKGNRQSMKIDTLDGSVVVVDHNNNGAAKDTKETSE